MWYLALSKIDFSALDWKKLILWVFILSVIAAVILAFRHVVRENLSTPSEKEIKKAKKK